MTAGAAVAFVLGYLIGSVDFAVLVARARGGDIYEMGSGNPGAANVLRNLGWRAALPVMLGDMAKGAGAAALGLWLGGSDAAGWAAGFAAVVGHCFPVWHRFRGGKGVATAFGVALMMEPLARDWPWWRSGPGCSPSPGCRRSARSSPSSPSCRD